MCSLRIIMHSLNQIITLGVPSAIKAHLLGQVWYPPLLWGLEIESATMGRPEGAM
jgi:hypothetical protein